jgi:hypothetical protein
MELLLVLTAGGQVQQQHWQQQQQQGRGGEVHSVQERHTMWEQQQQQQQHKAWLLRHGAVNSVDHTSAFFAAGTLQAFESAACPSVSSAAVDTPSRPHSGSSSGKGGPHSSPRGYANTQASVSPGPEASNLAQQQQQLRWDCVAVGGDAATGGASPYSSTLYSSSGMTQQPGQGGAADAADAVRSVYNPRPDQLHKHTAAAAAAAGRAAAGAAAVRATAAGHFQLAGIGEVGEEEAAFIMHNLQQQQQQRMLPCSKGGIIQMMSTGWAAACSSSSSKLGAGQQQTGKCHGLVLLLLPVVVALLLLLLLLLATLGRLLGKCTTS